MSKVKGIWIPVEEIEETNDPFDDSIYFHLTNGKVVSMHPFVKERAVDIGDG